jgi:sporulation protein YlmC with PRC-barrel domain
MIMARKSKPEPACTSTGDDAKLVGKTVVDSYGLELGSVLEVCGEELKLGEGPFNDTLLIKKSYIGEVGKRIVLVDTAQFLFEDMEIVDSRGRSVGKVTDVIATDDVIDGFIIKGVSDALFVVMEEIERIEGVRITLNVSVKELLSKQENRRRLK